jgi:uncharacterized SAM-binding protein YcdF (DUF218 family)
MNVHPFHMPRSVRREEAERAGFDPHEAPTPVPTHLRAGDGVDRLAVFAGEVEVIRATYDKDSA